MSDLDLSKIDLESLKSSSGSTVIAKEDVTPPAEILATGTLLIAIAIMLAIYFVRKFNVAKRAQENKRLLVACLTGWGVWCFVVFSYDKLFESYINYGLWFTLPPLCLILVTAWYRCFFAKK